MADDLQDVACVRSVRCGALNSSEKADRKRGPLRLRRRRGVQRTRGEANVQRFCVLLEVEGGKEGRKEGTTDSSSFSPGSPTFIASSPPVRVRVRPQNQKIRCVACKLPFRRWSLLDLNNEAGKMCSGRQFGSMVIP